MEEIPDPGWTFVEWTGDVSDPLSQVTYVEMLADRSATASFFDTMTIVFIDGFETGDTSHWTSTVP